VKIDSLDKFKLITYQNLDIDERNVVTLLYQPLIGCKAFSLYLTLWSFIDRSRLKTPEYLHKKLFDIIDVSPSTFSNIRKKLEAIGLLIVYQNDDLLLYELKAPLTAEEFIKDGSLGAYLFSKIGKSNFDEIVNLFRISLFEKKGFTNITTNFDEVFSSVPKPIKTEDSFMSRSKSKFKVNNNFDFDIFFEGLSKNFVDHRKITSRVKDKISTLSFVYNLDEFTMQKVFMDAVDKDKSIDFNKLSKSARYWFQFEKKTDNIDLLDNQVTIKKQNPQKEVIELCKKENPINILEHIFGSKPATSELRIIEDLIEKTELSTELINFLLVYSIGVTESFPSYNYFDKIAAEWGRNSFVTIEEAIEHIKKRNKKKTKSTTKQKNLLPKDIESDWLDDYIKKL